MRGGLASALVGGILVFLTGVSSTVLAQDPVQAGVSAAVRGSVQLARGETAVGRQIESGEPIFLGDLIQAGSDSGMQILLMDETVFTIGPNSELIIDTFVYDPDTGVGEVAASVTRGVFRFVTGNIAQNDPEKMTVSTPLGTIGIRGTIAGGTVTPERAEIVLLGPGINNNTPERSGAIIVSNPQGSVTIERTGYSTVLTPDLPPSVPSASGLDAVQGLDTEAENEESDSGNDEGDSGETDPSSQGSGTQSTGAQEGTQEDGKTAPSDGSTDASSASSLDNAVSESGQGNAISFSQAVNNVSLAETADNSTVASDVTTLAGGIGNINSITELKTGSGIFHFLDSGDLTDGGSYTIQIDIDFDARTIGGGNSAIDITASNFGTGDFAFLSNSFDSAGSTAVFDSQSNIGFTCGGLACTGAVVLTLRSNGDTVAGALEHTVTITKDSTGESTQTVGGSDVTTNLTPGAGPG